MLPKIPYYLLVMNTKCIHEVIHVNVKTDSLTISFLICINSRFVCFIVSLTLGTCNICVGYGACQKFIANIEGHQNVDELSSLR